MLRMHRVTGEKIMFFLINNWYKYSLTCRNISYNLGFIIKHLFSVSRYKITAEEDLISTMSYIAASRVGGNP